MSPESTERRNHGESGIIVSVDSRPMQFEINRNAYLGVEVEPLVVWVTATDRGRAVKPPDCKCKASLTLVEESRMDAIAKYGNHVREPGNPQVRYICACFGRFVE